MPILEFPDPRDSGPEGLVGVGGDLHPKSLLLAYSQGIFPWPMEGIPLAWFCPEERAILEFKNLHVPRSLERTQRKSAWSFSLDRAFKQVIRACAEVPRPGALGTWITSEMIEAYIQFHELGFAHSVEVWEGQELIGGIYGVSVEGAFAGESMFHLRPNASKLALLHLINHLESLGYTWIDIQVMTPHLEALGAKTLSRDAFLAKLARTQASFRKKPFPLF